MSEVTEKRPEKLWNRSYIFLLFVNTLNSFAFYMITTILSKYLTGIGIEISLAGVIVGLFSLTSLVCRPFCGLLSDRMNNLFLMKLSNVLMAIGLIGFVITDNEVLIILFRIINGVGFAINGTSQISLATRYIPDDKMGEGIGYIGLSMVLGSAVAPGLGLAISDMIGMKGTFIAAAAMTAAAFITLFTFHDRTYQPGKKVSGKIRFTDIISVKALPFTLVGGAYYFINGMIASYLVLFTDELGIENVSLYYTVCAIVLFVIRPFSGKLMDKKGIRVTVIPGLIVTGASMFILGRSTTLIMLLVTGVLRSLGQGAAQPSLQAGCINVAGRENSGVATSTYYLGGDIFQGISPMIGGFIVARIAGIAGYRVIFDLCGVWMFLILIFFIWTTRKKISGQSAYAGLKRGAENG